jgi:integrase
MELCEERRPVVASKPAGVLPEAGDKHRRARPALGNAEKSDRAGVCLGAAVRTRKLAIGPMESITKVPPRGESDHGTALDDDQLRKLVQGFKGNDLYVIVSTAAFTGARRNEILALRWSDLDPQKKVLRIERALEETKAHGIRIKGPKK